MQLRRSDCETEGVGSLEWGSGVRRGLRLGSAFVCRCPGGAVWGVRVQSAVGAALRRWSGSNGRSRGDEWMGRIGLWGSGMEGACLGVSVGRAGMLVCDAGPVQSGVAGVRVVCVVGGVGRGLIICTQCGRWICGRCGGVGGGLEGCRGFECGGCLDVVASVGVLGGGEEGAAVSLESVGAFCCLGGVLSTEGRVGGAVCCWVGYVPILTMRGTSLGGKGGI